MQVAISAASWVVGKALAPVTHGVLEAWAASAGLGPNVDALKTVLLYARALLDNAQEREIRSPALKELLHKLRQHAYAADDVLDELEYFRIQDELDGTYDAADVHAGGGCVHGVALNARHTARAVAAKLKPSSSSSGTIRAASSTAPRTTAQVVGKYLPCCSFSSVDDGNSHPGVLENQRRFLCWTPKVQQSGNTAVAPKLKFNRVEISANMMEIIEHLKHACAMVSNILNLEFMGTNRITKEDIAKKRPTTTSDITDNQLYGRDDQKDRVVRGIIDGGYFANNNKLVVLPIVGPGGIGKTTFTQQVYKDVKSHFEVAIWICVSLNFNATRLIEEVVKHILAKVGGQKEGNSSDQEIIEKKLKGKRFLLVLDDMWDCHDEEWKKLLAPFKKAGGEGNIVIVTTRFPKVANMVTPTVDPLEMGRLEDKDFMRLFEACVFVDQKPWEGDTKKLIDIGKKIVSKLNGFPLAAKTVGRLLRDRRTLKHWNQVLKSKEWELQKDDDDIMPALKLSYDYLPFNLQQCFYYCALYPEDYEFDSKELVHLWIGLDIIHPSDSNGRIEDVGQSYLDDLVDHGFFKKNKRNNGRAYYVVHDLLHDLAVNISSFECLSICSSNVKSVHIRQDIRHLSIIIDNKDVEDMMTFKYYKNDLSALSKRLKVENLRTVMVFGDEYGGFAQTCCDLFEKASALRAIYLSAYTVEDMLWNFSKLIHLRYLRIKYEYSSLEISLPETISRLYHLKILQKSWGCSIPSRHLSNLINMQHLISTDSLSGGIFNVGNLALLQELSRFEAKKENNGFELKQLANLQELDILGIYNLERVETKEEAVEAKLFMKTCLQKLMLHWDSGRLNKESAREEEVLESLKPSSNLVQLVIRGHGGATCPSWLGAELSVNNLEFLQLDDVSWEKLPPLGVLWFISGQGEECQRSVPGQSFKNLKRLELVKIPKLKKWIGCGPHVLFSELKVLVIKDCTELMELPFKHHIGCEAEHEDHMTCFPKLEELEISGCPKLSSLPCIPWTSRTCSARITQVGSGLEKLTYEKDYKSECHMSIVGKDDFDNAFWTVVGFHSLSELKELEVWRCPPLSLDHLQMLSSLKTLRIYEMNNPFLVPEGVDCAGYKFPVETISIREYGGSGEQLTRLLSCSPDLRYLTVLKCEKLTALGVANQKSTEAKAHIVQQQGTRVEEETASAAPLLLLPPQLQWLDIVDCPDLVLRPDSINSGTDAHGGGGLRGLRSLQWLRLSGCPRFLSLSSPSSSTPCFPFPASLESLTLEGVVGMETLLPLSNLTSLTELYIHGCEDLRGGEGLRHLALGRLTELTVQQTPNFFIVSEPLLQPCPPKLQKLEVDDVAGLLAGPFCSLLSCSLTELMFLGNNEVELERFTKHQEEALQLLTSLEKLTFWDCNKLQCLPAGLHKFPNLKILKVMNCEAMQLLPKDGLPSSLQVLQIQICPLIQSMPKECIPCSLRELDVYWSKSEELRRHCRKLKGTIPIVRA